MIQYTNPQNQEDLQKILDLQQANLPKNITAEEAKEQGFVTVEHDLELLSAMNAEHPHIIAKDGDEVVGYALVMAKKFQDSVPVLIPMFEQFNAVEYQGKKMRDYNYFTMGQVCIAKGYRGQGIFGGMYHKMGEQLSNIFEMVLTEIATKNVRSMRAHAKVGFKVLNVYNSPIGNEEWAIVGWDFR